ncbi:sigma-54 interacting response regulator protein [Burkholderiales bacterium GJ-E10]|nr:sigma-54 interacting response regulator protein [Burkholderiales bacterium GJ-E10]
MNLSDLPTLRSRVGECLEAMSGKPPTESAVKGWFAALRDLRLDHVVDALDNWLRTKSKIPTPADIRAMVGNRRGEEMERTAREDAARSPTPDQLRPATPNSPAYREFRARLAAMRGRTPASHRGWAYQLRARELAGKRLLRCQSTAWRAAVDERLPADDFLDAQREAAEERAAIVAESEIAEHA